MFVHHNFHRHHFHRRHLATAANITHHQSPQPSQPPSTITITTTIHHHHQFRRAGRFQLAFPVPERAGLMDLFESRRVYNVMLQRWAAVAHDPPPALRAMLGLPPRDK